MGLLAWAGAKGSIVGVGVDWAFRSLSGLHGMECSIYFPCYLSLALSHPLSCCNVWLSSVLVFQVQISPFVQLSSAILIVLSEFCIFDGAGALG